MDTCIYKVRHKDTNDKASVFSIKKTYNGTTMFLIFNETHQKFTWCEANEFKPFR
jgi:hypothetical protein